MNGSLFFARFTARFPAGLTDFLFYFLFFLSCPFLARFLIGILRELAAQFSRFTARFLAGYWPANSGATCAFSSAFSRRDFAPIVPRQQGAHFARFLAWFSAGFCPVQFGKIPARNRAVSSAVSGGDFAPPTAAQFARRPTFRFPRAGPPAARWRLELTFIALLTYVVNLSRGAADQKSGCSRSGPAPFSLGP